jgi:hypothetical protein
MTSQTGFVQKLKSNRFLLSTAAEIFGVLSIVAGISAISQGQTSSTLDAGFFILFGAMPYKSAKRRKLGLVKKYLPLRIGLEILAVLFIIFGTLVAGPIRMYNDPFPYLLCPLWAITAYAVVNFKNYETIKS